MAVLIVVVRTRDGTNCECGARVKAGFHSWRRESKYKAMSSPLFRVSQSLERALLWWCQLRRRDSHVVPRHDYYGLCDSRIELYHHHHHHDERDEMKVVVVAAAFSHPLLAPQNFIQSSTSHGLALPFFLWSGQYPILYYISFHYVITA